MNITIKGNGSSLWGDSNGEYFVTDYEIIQPDEDDEDYEEMKDYITVNVFSTNTQWCQYTDGQIESDVNSKLKPFLEKEIGRKISSIVWSEQGMQPYDGWNFDVVLSDS